MPASHSKLRWGPVHANNNVICAIDIRVGGKDALGSDLLEIAVLPLNHSYKVHNEFKLFNVRIRPIWDIDMKVARLNEESLKEFRESPNDAVGALTMFENWCETTLELKPRKQIFPLVWDWARIKPFMKMWMGDTCFADMIGEPVRDLMTLSNFMNDRCDFWGEDTRYKTHKFAQLLSRENIKLLDRNSMVANVKAMIEVYYQLLRGYIPGYSKP